MSTSPEKIAVRDGYVSREDCVWWMADHGAEYVTAASHWWNIKEAPSFYQVEDPHPVTLVEDEVSRG